MGKDDFADIGESDRGDGLVADHRERVLLEATAPALASVLFLSQALRRVSVATS